MPQRPVTVVTGPPCGGKSTYVEDHRRPGDLVLDLDAIYAALGDELDGRAHGEDLRRFAGAALTGAQVELEHRRREGLDHPRAWIIAGAPTPAQRHGFSVALVTTDILVLDTPREVCLARAEADGRPERYADIIGRWFDRFESSPFDELVEYEGEVVAS